MRNKRISIRQLFLAGMLGASVAAINVMSSCELTETTLCTNGGRCPPGVSCTVAGDGCVMDNCGDGVVDFGELCDDGNVASGDGCSEYCRSELCGNNVVDTAFGEMCDDGNTVSGDGCSGICVRE